MINQVTKRNARIALTNLFFWFSIYIFLPVLPSFYHKIGISNQQVGLLIGSFSIGALLFRFVSGKIADAIGCKYVSLLGIMVSCISILFYFFTSHWWVLLISRFFHGIGSALYSSAAITMVTLTNKSEDVKEAVSLYTLSSMLGIGAATGLAFIIYTHSSINIIILLSVLLTITSLFFFPRKTKNEHTIGEPAKNTSKPNILKDVIFNYNVYRPTINQFFVYFGYSAIVVFLPIILTSSPSKAYLWIFYVVYSISVVVSRLLVKRVTHFLSNEISSIIVLLSLSLGLFLVATSSSICSLAVIGALSGLSVGLATPIFVGIISTNTSPQVRGSSMGFFSTAIDLGMSAGSMFVGLMAATFTYKFIFLALCIICCLNVIIFTLFLNKKLKEKT